MHLVFHLLFMPPLCKSPKHLLTLGSKKFYLISPMTGKHLLFSEMAWFALLNREGRDSQEQPQCGQHSSRVNIFPAQFRVSAHKRHDERRSTCPATGHRLPGQAQEALWAAVWTLERVNSSLSKFVPFLPVFPCPEATRLPRRVSAVAPKLSLLKTRRPLRNLRSSRLAPAPRSWAAGQRLYLSRGKA